MLPFQLQLGPLDELKVIEPQVLSGLAFLSLGLFSDFPTTIDGQYTEFSSNVVK